MSFRQYILFFNNLLINRFYILNYLPIPRNGFSDTEIYTGIGFKGDDPLSTFLFFFCPYLI